MFQILIESVTKIVFSLDILKRTYLKYLRIFKMFLCKIANFSSKLLNLKRGFLKIVNFKESSFLK